MAENKDNLTFWDHIEELRWHLLRSAAAILIGAVLAFVFKSIVFDLILFGPIQTDFITYRGLCWLSETFGLGDSLCITEIPFTVINLDMAGQFTAHINISIMVGLILAFPYVMYEVWKFISPGLYDNERSASTYMVLSTSSLFLLGVLFGYYLLCPFSVNFLGGYRVSELIASQINLGSYVSTVTMVCLASALLFELPVFVFVLSKLGILTPEVLKKYRKHSVVGIVFVAAIITPPDITSQVVISIPVLFLYEIGIVISRRVQKQLLEQKQKELEDISYK